MCTYMVYTYKLLLRTSGDPDRDPVAMLKIYSASSFGTLPLRSARANTEMRKIERKKTFLVKSANIWFYGCHISTRLSLSVFQMVNLQTWEEHAIEPIFAPLVLRPYCGHINRDVPSFIASSSVYISSWKFTAVLLLLYF